MTSEQAASDAVAATVNAFGRLDILANNASYGNICPIEDTSLAEFHAQIETNLFGVINVTKAALPVMREQRSGHFFSFLRSADESAPLVELHMPPRIGVLKASRKFSPKRSVRSG